MTEPKPKRRLNLPILSLMITALLIVGVVLYWWIRVRPWTAEPARSPEEIQKLWEPVAGRIAISPAAAKGGQELLSEALKLLGSISRENLESAVVAWQKGEQLTAVQRKVLSDAAPAVARLVEWRRKDGGLGIADVCSSDEQFSAPELLLLARVALAQRDYVDGGAGRPELYWSVARLAHAMRSGGGPVLYVAGVRVLDDLLVSARRAGLLDTLREQRELLPAEEEAWRALNVEAYCIERLVGTYFSEAAQAWPVNSEAAAGVPQNWFRPTAEFLRRERLMVRLWWGERLRQVEHVRGDPGGLAEVLKVERDELPKSLMVRVIAVDLSQAMKQALESVEAYDEALKGEL